MNLFPTRNKATVNRMIAQAEKPDADAVIGIRLVTSQVATGAAELLAYGTAVRLRPAKGDKHSSSEWLIAQPVRIASMGHGPLPKPVIRGWTGRCCQRFRPQSAPAPASQP
ncbi:MAG: YbjQ family protein [Wenzhouxiangella sp.]